MTDLTTPADEPHQLLDVKAVADLLSCSVRHVYRLTDSGKMPARVRLGSLVRWNAVEIQKWVEQGCPSVRSMRRKPE